MGGGRALAVILAGALASAACSGSSQELTGTPATDSRGGTMEITSQAFRPTTRIPTRYTCDGEDVSPPLTITGVPPGTETLALVVEDPDAPRGTWDHWIAYDLPVVDEIPEAVGPLGTGGTNSGGSTHYQGPCPPSGEHRYLFTVYAVDTHLGLAPGATKEGLRKALQGHTLDEATLIGLYSR